MNNERLFRPERVQVFAAERIKDDWVGGDTPGLIYIYRPEIELAVEVALITRRPLLLSGPSGCGKSSLARNVALVLDWHYVPPLVVTSRTEAQHLLWEEDHLKRLRDAQREDDNVEDTMRYVTKGPLWEALEKGPSVLLIDEIDKADPGVPNDLLGPLGKMAFPGPTGKEVTGEHAPLVFITTNGERELPRAFIRRCICLELLGPEEVDLVAIGRAHFREEEVEEELLHAVASEVAKLGKAARGAAVPSTAEFLDTVRACLELEIRPSNEGFDVLRNLTLAKRSMRGA